PGLRCAWLLQHEIVGSIMAEYHTIHAPVRHLLGAWQDSLGAQPMETFSPIFIAFSPAHTMAGSGAFIPIIASEIIQLAAMQATIMSCRLLEIPSHMAGGLGRTEVGLRPACPSGMGRMAPVCVLYCVLLTVGRCVQIVIPVLIMDSEES